MEALNDSCSFDHIHYKISTFCCNGFDFQTKKILRKQNQDSFDFEGDRESETRATLWVAVCRFLQKLIKRCGSGVISCCSKDKAAANEFIFKDDMSLQQHTCKEENVFYKYHCCGEK
jgi:hypothetical protein